MISKPTLFAGILFLFVSLNVILCSPEFVPNDRPIIGVMTEETSQKFSNYGSSAITASYVKFLEFAGARVVPVLISQPLSYYEDIFSKINGVLFPGGGNLLRSDGYGRTGKILFDLAVKANDNGDYFPLWGTCLGFELLNYLAANQTLWMKACAAEDVASPLTFLTGYNESRMFQNLDVSLMKVMRNNAVTINYHQWCITQQNYTSSGLNRFFKTLSLSKDSRGLTYISSVEARNYPFYGVQFHPEKVLFEWVLSKSHHNIPHTEMAVKTSQYFANFFVNEAKKSKHTFPNKTAEDDVLIYNYQPTFTGKENSTTEQNYFFL